METFRNFILKEVIEMARMRTGNSRIFITDHSPEWNRYFSKNLAKARIEGGIPSSFIQAAQSAGGSLSPAQRLQMNTTYGMMGNYSNLSPSEYVGDSVNYNGPESPDWAPNNIDHDGIMRNPRRKRVYPKKIRNRNILKDIIGKYSALSIVSPMLERAIPELIKILATGRVYVDIYDDIRIPHHVLLKWKSRNTLYRIPGLQTMLNKITDSCNKDESKEISANINSSVTTQYGDIIITKNMSVIFRTSDTEYMVGVNLKRDLESIYTCYKQYLKVVSKRKKSERTQLLVRNLDPNYGGITESMICKPLSNIFSLQKRTVCNLISALHRSNKLGAEYGVKSTSAIMLHGKPGTGKTEMIRSIAYELQCKYSNKSSNFNYVEITPTVMDEIGRGVDDCSTDIMKHLKSVCNTRKPTSNNDLHLILFDDCDSWLGNRDDLDSTASADSRDAMMYNFTLSFMKLLSDGIPGLNVIMVFTTNYPERIDKALLRAGRIDQTFEITDIPKNLAEDMVKSFDENPEEILENETFPINPAYLQQQILVHKFGADRVRSLPQEETTVNEENS